jgi:hypothetical protein
MNVPGLGAGEPVTSTQPGPSAEIEAAGAAGVLGA